MITAILEHLRGQGLTVVEVNGWQTRGRPAAFHPIGSVNHHTAGAPTGVAPSLGSVTNGRGEPNPLSGPLANVLQSRKVDASGLDVVYLVAAGTANHAGEGQWLEATDNPDVWGLEVEHVGTTAEPFPEGRIETSVRIHTAFALCSGFDAAHVCQHYEWAGPRKVDFVRALLDPDDFRRRISARLHPSLEDDMPTLTPSWSKRNTTTNRLPFFRLVVVDDNTAQVLAYPGVPLAGGLDKITAPKFAYGKSGAIPALTVDGLASKAVGLGEAPDGSIDLLCADGSTFLIARKP